MNFERFRDPSFLTYPEATIARLFWGRVARSQEEVAALEQVADDWKRWSWKDIADQVRNLALALRAKNIGPGDVVGIYLPTSVSWEIADYAIASLRAVSASIYDRSKPNQVADLLRRCEAKAVIVPNAVLLSEILSTKIASLRLAIVREGTAPSTDKAVECISWSDLIAPAVQEDDAPLEQSIVEATSDEPHTIVFTSGTTGEQRGALLNSRNFVSVVTRWHFKTYGVRPTIVAYLPLAHVLQRATLYRRVYSNYLTAYPRGIEHLQSAMRKVHPHMFAVVPRILEKMRDQILDHVRKLPEWRRRIFDWGLATNLLWLEAKTSGRLGFGLRLSHILAHFLVSIPVRRALGRRIRYLACGSAPLDPALERFFWALGIKILQGYGLTETTAPATANTPRHYKLGTVGRAMPGVEIKIAPDGEIFVRGESVFQGYYKDPEATKAAFEGDWFKTGDLGEIDSESYLKITGRKKELIVTVGGKKIAPAPIESVLRQAPGVQEVMVVGEGRSHLGALFFLEPGNSAQAVEPAISERLAEHNRTRAGFEQIRKHRVIPRPLSVESGELTATLKIRRKFVENEFAKEIDGLYVGPPPS